MSTQAKTAATPTKPSRLGGVANWVDERAGIAGAAKKQVRKVFPDHWSFMLGEIALWSFVVLLLTGTFLTLWFKPSMAEVVYDGSYDQLRGLEMSEAYASTLHLSFEVRGGLLMRQMHHWAAMLFVGAMLVLHATHGWYPLLPIFRRMGVRTRDEIDRERYGLKALRGDFTAIPSGGSDAADRAAAVWKAVCE